MSPITARVPLILLVLLIGNRTLPVWAGDWTPAVEVRQESERCLSYRARWSGPVLVVQARLEPGWHTFAIDNKERALEKLAGRKSLGIDLPTEIKVSEGLEVIGPWFQSPPKDFSKPELRWFSWGFDDEALFAVKVRRTAAGPARVSVRAQACTETTCRNIDVSFSVPLQEGDGQNEQGVLDFERMVRVR
ncbi:MAG: hypothetical protein AB1898_18735 [Acidobacteriota bacterium]